MKLTSEIILAISYGRFRLPYCSIYKKVRAFRPIVIPRYYKFNIESELR